MPGGNPDALDQLANALDRQAGGVGDLAAATVKTTAQIQSDAAWSGDAADGYLAFSRALARGVGRAETPLSKVASAARGYAGYLRAAQRRVTAYEAAARQAQASGGDPAYVQAARAAAQDAAQANVELQAAGDQAAAQIRAAVSELDGIFAPEGALRDVLEKIHAALGASGADGALWAIGKGAEAAEKFMRDLPKLEAEWLHEVLPWEKNADLEEWQSAVSRWWAKADAADAFGGKFLSDTRVLGLVSRFGRLAGGPLGIAGDVSTIFNPPQAGWMGHVDQIAAFANASALGADTLGAAGQLLGAEAVADLSLGPVGAGIAVGTGVYLAGAYAYQHWAPFRHVAQDIGHGAVDVTRDVGHGLADAAHTVASWF